MKNKLKIVLAILCAAVFANGNSWAQSNQKEKLMELPQLTEQEKEAGILTTEVMLKLARLSGSILSPNGETIVYALNVQDIENNRSYTNLFALIVKSNETTQLTFGEKSNSSAQFNKDGSKVYYSSNEKNGSQIWIMNIDGSDKNQISNVKGGIRGFNVAPTEDKVYYAKTVKVDQTAKDMYPEYKKNGAMIYDDLMVRHWDYWTDGTYSHIFVANLANGSLSGAKDINKGESWDTPYAPYFPMGNITWSNDGTKIAYSSKKMTGYEYAKSTNSDIYIYDTATGQTENITKEHKGYDNSPSFSPDDKKIAWISMEREGNEADKERLFIKEFATGNVIDLTKDFDTDAGSIVWDGNDDIYFIAPLQATHQLCKVEVKDGAEIEVLTEGLQDYNHLTGIAKDKIYLEKTTISSPTDIISISKKKNRESQVTEVNKHILDFIKMGEVQKRWVETTDGKQMLTWVILPPNFDANVKHPAILYCQGGPQSAVSQFWSYRWNLQVFAAQGYVVVAPNRRGLPSFGQEWNDQISGDYSGQNIKDYLSAIDDVSKENYVDKDRLGCVGASYGGYSTFYLAGHHEKRFKALISHCGMFNLESFYGSTEELWFPANDLGGAYWEEGETIKRSYDNSPHKFVDKWDTPILIIVGLNDFRIPYAESLQAFTAARSKGLDSRLLVFEDEAHQVFKPQNSLIWHNEFFNWLDKYLKK